MTLRPSSLAVISSAFDGVFCIVPIAQIDEIVVRIGNMTCCIVKNNFCIAQNTDVTLRLQAATTSDFSGASEVYFTVYSNSNLTTEVFQKSLSAGQISQPSDYEFSVALDPTDTALAANRYYWECAAITAGGKQKALGQGVLRIEETGAFDA